MALDAFGREIQANIDELREQLLKEEAEKADKETADRNANTVQLKRLNDILEKIFGTKVPDKIKDELKDLKETTEEVVQVNETIVKNQKSSNTATGSKFSERAGVGLTKLAGAVKELYSDFGKVTSEAMKGTGYITSPKIKQAWGDFWDKFLDAAAALRTNKAAKTLSGIAAAVNTPIPGTAARLAKRQKELADYERQKGETERRGGSRFETGRRFGGGVGNIVTAENPLIKGIELGGPKLAAGIGKAIGKINPFVGGATEGFLDTLIKPVTAELENQEKLIRTIFIQSGRDAEATTAQVSTLSNVEESIVETGQMRNKIQETQLKNLRRGITETTKLNRVTNLGLQTATRIGANADHTADLFTDWHLELNASNQQLNLMKSGLLDIARTTGVFGDKLLKAAQDSKEFMMNMQRAGTFTATAANNMIEFLARAEKTGTSEGGKKLIGALSGSIFREGVDEKTRGLILRGAARTGGDQADVQKKLLAGTITSDRRLFNKLIEGMISDFESAIGKKFEDLTPDEIGTFNYILESTFGPLNELNINLKHLRDTTAGFEAKMAKTIKQTEKEELTTATVNKVLGEFSDALRQSKGDMQGAIGILSKPGGDLGPLLKAIGGKDISSLIDFQADAAAKKIKGLTLSDAVKKDFATRIATQKGAATSALEGIRTGKKGSPEELSEALGDLSKTLGDALMQQEAQANPVYQLNQSVREMFGALSDKIAQLITVTLPPINDALQTIAAWVKNNKGLALGGAAAASLVAFAAAVTLSTGALVGGAGGAAGAAAFVGAISGPLGIIAALAACGVALYQLKVASDDLNAAQKEMYKQDKQRLDIIGGLTPNQKAKVVGGDVAGLVEDKARAARELANTQKTFLETAQNLGIVPKGLTKFEDLNQEDLKKINEFLGKETRAMDGLEVLAREMMSPEERNRRAALVENSKSLEVHGKKLENLSKALEDANKKQFQMTTGSDLSYDQRKAAFTPEQAAQEKAAKERFFLGGENRNQRLNTMLGDMAGKDLGGLLKEANMSNLLQTEGKTAFDKADKINKLFKALEQYVDVNNDKMTYVEYEQALKQMILLQKLQEKFNDEGLNKGSIFTHDIHTVAAIEDLGKVIVTAMPPRSSVEEEIKRKKAEVQTGGGSDVEDNTRDIAISNRQIVGVLKQIGRMLSSRGKGAGTDQNFNLEPFYDEPLSVNWQNADNDNNVGTEFTTL